MGDSGATALQALWIPSVRGTGLAWLGGIETPVLAVRVAFAEVGLLAAATWERGRPGALLGATVGLRIPLTHR